MNLCGYLSKEFGSARFIASLPVLALLILVWQPPAFAISPTEVFEDELHNKWFSHFTRELRARSAAGTNSIYLTGAPTGLTVNGFSRSGSVGNRYINVRFGWTGDISSDTTFRVFGRRMGNNRLFSGSSTSDLDMGTITIKPTVKELRVSSPTNSSRVTEGSATTSTFTVRLGQAPSGNVTVAVSSSDTTEGTVSPSTLTFTTMNYSTAQTVTVSSAQDTVHDGTQSWNVVLNPASSADSGYNGLSNVNVAMSTADDAADAPTVTLQLSSAWISENPGSTNGFANVTATLSSASTVATTVTVGVAAGAGASSSDFSVTSNRVLTIAAGQTTSTGTVTIGGVNNNAIAADKSVTVSGTAANTLGGVSNPSDLTLTIRDDDGPTFTIDSPSVAEGDSGSTTMTFTVSLSPTSTQQVTVNYAGTTTGTATSGTDYAALSGGTLTFAAGETSQTFTVSVTGDTIDEPAETIVVRLSNPMNAIFGGLAATLDGTGTITDDDVPAFSIDSPTVTEGDSGSVTMTFTVSLSPVSYQQVTVNYADATTGTATSGTDYTAISGGTLTFTAGIASQTFTVAITGDVITEGNETIVISLSSNSSGTSISTASGTGTIADNETPTLSINSPSAVTEGDSGSTTMTFTVSLSPASNQQVTVNYSAGGTATSGVDFAAASGTLTFAVGDTSQTIDISVTGDTIDEPDETVVVTLSGPNPSSTPISTASGTGTITDDDVPAFSIDSPTVTEGDSGMTTMTFTVSLNPVSHQPVSVNYADGSSGTAASGTDYAAITSGTLNFAAGIGSQTIDVSIIGDTTLEGNETFTVSLSSASSGTTIATATGSGTIVNDDGPKFSIDSPEVPEGNRGETTMTFTVTLSPAPASATTVTFADAGTGSADSGTDYTAIAGGTLSFAATETSKTIEVTVLGDNQSESSETIVIALSNPNPAHTPITTPTGTGTIVDDDRVLSTDSSLSGLVLSTGELSPTFSSSTLSYTATVDRSVERLTVTPTASTGVSGIRVNSQRVSSGSESGSIELSFGENTVSVLVLAENLAYRVYQIVVTREETDRTPDDFSFAAQSDAEPGSTVTSEAITVAGLGEGESAEISVSGGTLIVDGSEFSGTTVTNGQRVAVSVVASNESGGTATAMVTIGGISADFTVATRDASSADQTPDAFSFAAQSDAEPGSTVTSSTIRVAGLGEGVAAAISVSGGTLEVDGRGFSGTTVMNGQQVAVSVVASREFGGTATAVVTIGGVRGEFTATTRAASSNAELGSLSFLPAARLNPSFTSGTVSYTATVSGQISTLTVLATPAHSGASVNISPMDASASTTGHQMNLNAGSNTATIVVTAEDNRTRKTYTVAVTRVETAAMEAIGELEREIVTEVSREVASSTLQAIAGRISSAVGNVPAVVVPTTGSATGLLPILEVFDRHDRDSSSTQSTLHQSLDGANFVLSLASGNATGSMQVADEEDGMAPGGMALWGSADNRNMSGGKNSTVSWDGELFSVHVGTDALLESGLLVGLSAGVSRGTFDYSGGNRNTRGQLKTRMTSLHPYLGWAASDRLNLWMTAGYGQGRIEYNDGEIGQFANDTALTTAAFGSRYRLDAGEQHESGNSIMVALKTEAWGTRLTVKGNEARLEKSSIRTHGVRLAVEGSQERMMETGATLMPFVELGVRWDGGAGDTGTGVEIGGGMKLLNPCLCLTVDASARYLVSHESGRKEWGVGASVRRDSAYSGTGMSYGMSLSHGETGSKIDSLWEGSAAGRVKETDRLTTRLEAEVGYSLYGTDGIYTPYTGLGLTDNGFRDYAVGIRYAGEAALSLGLELSRFEKTDKSPDHRIMLTGQIDW